MIPIWTVKDVPWAGDLNIRYLFIMIPEDLSLRSECQCGPVLCEGPLPGYGFVLTWPFPIVHMHKHTYTRTDTQIHTHTHWHTHRDLYLLSSSFYKDINPIMVGGGGGSPLL